MKCPECGEELESGALFCWSCGCKITGGGSAVRYCMSCGEPMEGGSKFCANCGSKVDSANNASDDIYLDDEEASEEAEEAAEEAEVEAENGTRKDGPFSKFKRWLSDLWDGLDGYSQFCVGLLVLLVYCLILSITARNTLGNTMTVLQMIALGFLYCIRNKVAIRNAKPAHGRLLWILIVILNVVFIMSFRAG